MAVENRYFLTVCMCLSACLSVMRIPMSRLYLSHIVSFWPVSLTPFTPPPPDFPVFKVAYERTRAAAIQPYSVIVLKNP